MKKSNRQILTNGKQYKQNIAKKHGADVIVFDKDSRLEYLTGFHKRKLERQKKAKEFAKEQERLIKIQERKKLRDDRKCQAAEQLNRLKESMVYSDEKDNKNEEHDGASEAESWDGFSDSDDISVKPILKRQKQVYDDETTVEIEPLESNDNFRYLAEYNNVKLENSKKVLEESIDRAKKYARFLGMDDKLVRPKKKFRYLTKTERRANQRKANAKKRRRN